MCITNESDLKGLRRAGGIVSACLREMRRLVRPGVTTADLNEAGARVLRSRQARSAPMIVYRFPAEFCISVNDELVHGVPSGRRLVEGDLVKIDVTVEKDGYMADAAITVPVGSIDERRRTLVECARRALWLGLASARAGEPLNSIGRAIEREVVARGLTVVRDLTGHGIGRTIHEAPAVPNYDDPAATRLLTEGLVLAVEPIISSGSGRTVTAGDGWTVKTEDGSTGAHWEHTVVVTRGRPLLLTA